MPIYRQIFVPIYRQCSIWSIYIGNLHTAYVLCQYTVLYNVTKRLQKDVYTMLHIGIDISTDICTYISTIY